MVAKVRHSEGPFGPFAHEPPEKVQLDSAPLAKVLCQVRWPDLTEFKQRFDTIAESIGASIATEYPFFDKRQEQNFVVGPGGISATPGKTVYEWASGDNRWHVHFSDTFITIETKRYTNKEDLLDRLGAVLTAVAENVSIPIYNRVGYRYINCVDAAENIESLIRVEVRGGEAVPVRPGAELIRTVTETLYRVDGDHLLARWAKLPSGVLFDPGIPPLQSDSWILDLDAYSEREEGVPFDPSRIVETATRLGGRGYTFFRWSVTDDFLAKFGVVK
jgi:uncharacterized protein (TIGR04255 family)